MYAPVDTRGPNDGLHFHGCIGKNHSSIFVPVLRVWPTELEPSDAARPRSLCLSQPRYIVLRISV